MSRCVAQERGSWRQGCDSPFPSSGRDLHKGSFGHLPPPGETSSLLRPEVLTYAERLFQASENHCRVCPEPNQLQLSLINPRSIGWIKQVFLELIFCPFGFHGQAEG